MRRRSIWALVAGLVLYFALTLASENLLGTATIAAAQSSRQVRLEELIVGASKEGELIVWGVSGLGADGAETYGEAFKASFGLKHLRFKYDTAGATGEKFSRAVMETKMGLPASYDVMYAPEHRVVSLIEKGGVEPIEGWEQLLPERVKPKTTSPPSLLAKPSRLQRERTGLSTTPSCSRRKIFQ